MRARHRLLVTLIATGLTTALIVAAGAIWSLRAAVERPVVERVRAEAALLAQQVRTLEPTAAQAWVEEAARRLDVRITLIAADGTVVADSALAGEGVLAMEGHLERPEVREAGLRGSGESLRRSTTTGLRYFYVAQRVDGDAPVRYIRLALQAGDLLQARTGYAVLLLGIVLASTALSGTLAYVVVRRLSRPLEVLSDAVERVAAGRHETTLPAEGPVEVARLGAAVRRMQSTLLAKLGELGAEQQLLTSVIGGMREGLLLVGADRRVRLANAAARRILDLRAEPGGHLLAEVARHPDLHHDVTAALESGAEARESMVRTADGRSFALHVTPLRGDDTPGGAEALVLLYDVTRLESLEGVRRQFVANVSHELRTPLTSIRAFVENLLDGGLDEPERARDFVTVIRNNADRMGALIEDLTDLSLIETGAVQLELRPIDAAEVCREIVEQLEPRARAAGVELTVAVPAGLTILADRRRVEQALTNLVENAVKFNRKGGHVRVTGRSGPPPTISVEDDGIGIPSDSRDKIFNRFYQIDPARSRKAGGTGLGLAIVKHLMRLQGGTVSVKSELGHGSTFTLEFAADS